MHLVHDPALPPAPIVGFDDFLAVDIRCGTVIEALPFPEARKPAYWLTVDFGPGVGVRKSSVQVTENYTLAELLGRRVLAVVNFPPRQIGPVRSEVLILGCADADGHIVLVAPDAGMSGQTMPDGARLA